MQNAKTTPILFLSGFSQGGTTLFLSLMDGHPDLFVYPDEPNFSKLYQRRKNYTSARQLWLDSLIGTPNTLMDQSATPVIARKSRIRPAVPADEVEAALAAWYTRVDTLSTSMTLRGLDDNPDIRAFIHAYYDRLREVGADSCPGVRDVVMRHLDMARRAQRGEREPRFLTFKEPVNDLRNVVWLNGFQQTLGNARMIFVWREPLARLSSILTVLDAQGKSYRLRRNPLRFLSLAWNNARDYAAFRKLSAGFDQSERVLTLRYERIVEEPEAVMLQVCNWLDLPFDPILTQPTKLGFPVNPPSNRTESRTGLTRSSIDKWKSVLSRSEILIARCMLFVNRVTLAV